MTKIVSKLMRSTFTLCFGCALLALGAVMLPQVVHAQTVAVGNFDGRGSALVRSAAIRGLRDEGIDVVNSRDVERAAERLGVGVEEGRYAISGELGISAWIEGEMERAGRNSAVTMAVIDASTGQTLGVMSYEARNPKLLAKRVERGIVKDLGDLIGQAQAPARQPAAPVGPVDEPEPVRPKPQAEEEPAEEEAEEEEAEDEDEPADEAEDGADAERLPPLDLSLAFVGFSRSFEYNDDLSSLNTYDLPLGPSAQLEVRWYPAAHFSNGAASHFGLDVRGAFAFGIDSELRGTAFSTSSRAIGVGLRARLPLGDHELGALVGYGNQTFDVASASDAGGTIDPGVPSASYSFLRLGGEVRLAFGALGLGLRAAYLPTFSSGEVEKWFPRSDVRGFEAQAIIGYSLSEPLKVEASVGFQRFGFAFNPKLEDASAGKRIAGGATDEYLSGTLGLRWIP